MIKMSRDRIKEEVKQADRNANIFGITGAIVIVISVFLFYLISSSPLAPPTLWISSIIILGVGVILLFGYYHYYSEYKKYRDML